MSDKVIRRAAIVFATFGLFVILFSCLSEGQSDRLAQAVPGFSCDGMEVGTISAQSRITGRVQRATSALRMPPECLLRLQRAVVAAGYAHEACGVERRCYSLRRGSDRYRFDFDGGSTVFRYERSGS